MSVPAATPVTIPVELITALVLLTFHVPPPTSVSDVMLPLHTDKVPEIAEGSGLIVIGVVVTQPVGNVYVIVASPAVPFTDDA